MNGHRYYLDYAAATPVDERVIAAMLPYLADNFFNPSSPYEPAVKVRREYEQAKARLASTFGAKGDEVIITAGATESINLAFSGCMGHVVTSSIEHDAVLAAAALKPHTYVSPTPKGTILATDIAAAITPQTTLVSVQLANNEIGTIQPIREIARVVIAERTRRSEAGESNAIYLHTDASQGFGQVDVNVGRLGVDLLTLNAAKMYGPKQVGLLWVKPGTKLTPLLVGGGQERGLRSGTENVAGTIGFALAAEIAHQKQRSESARLMALRDALQHKLTESFDQLIVSGHPKRRLAGSLHVSIPGVDGERLIFLLETKGVYVATGSACAANKGTRSHVLQAIGMDDSAADGSLRLTLGRHSSESAINEATDIILDTITQEIQRVARA